MSCSFYTLEQYSANILEDSSYKVSKKQGVAT